MNMQQPDWRNTLGAVGLWSTELRTASDHVASDAAGELEGIGYRSLWIPGLGGGHAAFDAAANLLHATTDAHVILGVVGIWGQTAATVAEATRALTDQHGHRLLVGLGVSGPESAAYAGQRFGSPIRAMADYLDQLDLGPTQLPVTHRLLGALGPRMVALAAQRTAGIHPFLVTSDAITLSRDAVGPQALIAPHLAVVLETDPHVARTIARDGIGMYIGFPSYQANLRRLGFDDTDLIPGGSNRLIDAVVAWGDPATIASRIHERLDAGADHIALHVLTANCGLPWPQWHELADLVGPPANRPVTNQDGSPAPDLTFTLSPPNRPHARPGHTPDQAS